jgi:hypothetical protein
MPLARPRPWTLPMAITLSPTSRTSSATPPFRELFVEIAHPLFDPRVTSVWLADDG